MQFIIIAYDGTDDKALERRMAVREDHLTNAEKFFANGKWLYACAILNDAGDMIGSTIICDFSSREELEEQWLNSEPYVLGDVWKNITIHPARVPPMLLER